MNLPQVGSEFGLVELAGRDILMWLHDLAPRQQPPTVLTAISSPRVFRRSSLR